MQALQCRCDVMFELWEREKAQMIKEQILKKTKKKNSLLKKLNMISDET